MCFVCAEGIFLHRDGLMTLSNGTSSDDLRLFSLPVVPAATTVFEIRSSRVDVSV